MFATHECARQSGRNDAALWIVWSVERTMGAAGVDLCRGSDSRAWHQDQIAIPGARVLAGSRKPNVDRRSRHVYADASEQVLAVPVGDPQTAHPQSSSGCRSGVKKSEHAVSRPPGSLRNSIASPLRELSGERGLTCANTNVPPGETSRWGPKWVTLPIHSRVHEQLDTNGAPAPGHRSGPRICSA